MPSRTSKATKRGEWKRGVTRDFLELDDGHAGLVVIREALARAVRERRRQQRLTQAEVAELAATTQSRVAKVENAQQEVSMDLCLRVLLALGASPERVARAIADAL